MPPRGGRREERIEREELQELRHIKKALHEIRDALKNPVGNTKVAFSFTINPGGKTVKILPDVVLFNTQKQPLDLNPVGPGATDPDESIHGTVTSSDESQVGVVVVDADANQYELTTPLDSGEATITISGNPKIEDVQFKVVYTPFVQGQWNPVLGEPVADA